MNSVKPQSMTEPGGPGSPGTPNSPAIGVYGTTEERPEVAHPGAAEAIRVGSRFQGIGRRAFLGAAASAALGISTRGRADRESPALAIYAETLLTMAGPPIRNGVVLVRGGRIAAIGAGISVPSGAAILRATVVMPGLIDAHTHLGCLYERDEPLDAITPDLCIRDGFDASDPALQQAVRAGVTAACVMPGNGNAIGGQGSLYRLGASLGLLREYAAQKFSLTAANSQRNPTSRGGVIALIRAALDGARRGQAVSSVTQTDLLSGFPTRLDERARALLPVVSGERPVFVHAPASDDVENALAIFDTYRLKGCLLHASQAFEVSEEIARRHLPVVLGPLRFEDDDRTLTNAGRLAKAGIPVAFCSDAPLSDPASLRLSAALAVKYGMDRTAATRALTRTPAEILGVDKQTGSLQRGMDADLLLLSGDPLNLTSRVLAVVSGGLVAYAARR